MVLIKLPKINLQVLRRGFFIVLISILFFVFGYGLGLKGFIISSERFPKVSISREIPAEKGNLDFSLFWKVWDTISQKYFDKSKVIESNLVYGAIRGMVNAVGDPYTAFFSPNENKIVQEDLQGNFDGVGIQIGFRASKLTVVAPLPGSPAEKAGVKPGDYIAGIRDDVKGVTKSTEGLSLPEAVNMIRGKAGTIVTLTLVREKENKPIVVDLMRQNIAVPSLVFKLLDGGDLPNGIQGPVAYVRIVKFGGETEGEWENAVLEILKNGHVRGIVIDLRNNPGGYLQGAVDLASDFLETGEVVVIEEDGNGNRTEDKVQKLGRLKNDKVVVLVNGGSASASEIFSGALRDDKKIQLVGETTFGKGTIQEPEQLNGGSGLHITIARWLTPSGYWVNEKGLVPDVKIEDNPETAEDEQLTKAIEILSQIN